MRDEWTLYFEAILGPGESVSLPWLWPDPHMSHRVEDIPLGDGVIRRQVWVTRATPETSKSWRGAVSTPGLKGLLDSCAEEAIGSVREALDLIREDDTGEWSFEAGQFDAALGLLLAIESWLDSKATERKEQEVERRRLIEEALEEIEAACRPDSIGARDPLYLLGDIQLLAQKALTR